jgi:pyruvate,orthophosphate dikinase
MSRPVSGVDTDALFVSFRFPANIAPRSLQFSFPNNNLMAKKVHKAASKKVSVKAKRPTQKPVSSKKIRYVYYFGDGRADGDGKMKPLLGGKGANLHEMTRIGLPIPPGFTISTDVCTYFYENKKTYPSELSEQVEFAVAKVEKSVGKKLADRGNPLLLSVRSGARDSMPGMMDTILNLGMNDGDGRPKAGE